MNEARRLGTCTDTLTRRKKVYLLLLSSYTATPSYWNEGSTNVSEPAAAGSDTLGLIED